MLNSTCAFRLGAQQEALGFVVAVQHLQTVVEQWQQVLRRGQNWRSQIYLVVVFVLARITAIMDADDQRGRLAGGKQHRGESHAVGVFRVLGATV